MFPAENRKQPSVRTLQRYCQEGRFDCFKLKTTRNCNPVHEWIINGNPRADIRELFRPGIVCFSAIWLSHQSCVVLCKLCVREF